MPQTALREHFEDLSKQAHAARLALWVFVVSEIFLFSGLFALIAGYRVSFPKDFHEAAGHTSLGLSIAMNFILLTATFLMAESVPRMRAGERRHVAWLLQATFILGIAFLIVEGVEWAQHFQEGIFPGVHYRFTALPDPGANIFFSLFFMANGVHVLHILGGVGAVGWLVYMIRSGQLTPSYHPHLALTAMYWQFLYIIWLFLWVLFYLLRK